MNHLDRLQLHDLASLLERRVNIYVTRDVAFNIDKLNRVTQVVLGKIGCDNCHSGRFFHYQILEDFIVNPKTLDVTELPVGPQF